MSGLRRGTVPAFVSGILLFMFSENLSLDASEGAQDEVKAICRLKAECP
jgi:hypothetical protein